MQYQSLLFSKYEQISANVVFATLLLYFGYPRKSIFSSSVDSKLIRDRTGHRSDALLKYEKAEEKVFSHVRAILCPNPCTGKVDSEQDTVVIEEKEFSILIFWGLQ